jgi:hypothetical protein
MPWFRTLVRGENFLMSTDGKTERLGFYTTRFVEAEGPEGAEMAAVESIRADTQLAQAISNDRSDPPMIFVDEIQEIMETDILSVGSGFTFFPTESP